MDCDRWAVQEGEAGVEGGDNGSGCHSVGERTGESETGGVGVDGGPH